jgi:N-acetylmuramic acid 6-phosphate etherase
MLNTESPSDKHPDLDQYAVDDLVEAFIDDQAQAIDALRRAAPRIAEAASAAVARLQRGGRLVYVGAGTSGRIGVLDSVELLPTFSWPKTHAVAVLAGGQGALFDAAEGAEDSAELARRDLDVIGLGPHDVVLLISASGTTPFTLGALDAARDAGALSIAIANNPGAPLTQRADIAITLDTGSELISGSTRLKAGTAQKIALNTLSSAIMVRLNKVYGNLMVDLHPSNDKLYRRAVSLTMQVTGADEDSVRRTLEACGWRVKVAIVALLRHVDAEAAEQRLAASGGSVRAALGR